MIILPPEEKKSSPVLKWIFRILLIVVVTAGVLIFALNILSGTTDAHRRGLEQALSDMFQTNVTIGILKEFNIFPLFNIEMENVRGHVGSEGSEVRAGRVQLTFRFFDLLFNRDLVKDIQLTHLTIPPGVVGAHDLKITSAGIVPIKAQGERPAFRIQGQYGGLPVKATLELEMIGGIQPVYRIKNDLPAQVNFGKIGISGKFVQNEQGEPSIQNADLMIDSKSVATVAFTLLTSKPASEFKIDFSTAHSKGSLTTYNEPKSQVWDFEKIDLSDILSKAPAWVQVSNAFAEISPPTTASSGDPQSTLVTIEIKAVTGDVSLENIKGTFISTPESFVGAWDGTIINGSTRKGGALASGKVECGLLSLLPKGSIWSTDNALVITEPASISSKLAVHVTTGRIDWSIDRVASGQPTTFNVDLAPFQMVKQDLRFPAGHPCLSYIDKVSAQ